jgi:class 3 adenylate cyclase
MEGSTRLLQALGDRYSGVLAEHHRLLRDAFALHGGVERGSAGDGLYFVFPTARSAVLAAVEGQLAIGAHAWPDGIAIRDRMGLHTGEPRAASEGYVGLDVHRAARICAAGHGGQILISQTTRSLAAWGGAAHAAGGASAGVTPAPKRGFGAVAGARRGAAPVGSRPALFPTHQNGGIGRSLDCCHPLEGPLAIGPRLAEHGSGRPGPVGGA